MIGDAQERVERLLLRVLRLGEEPGVLKRERGGERDLFEVVQVQLSEGPIGSAAHGEDPKHAPTGAERQHHPRAHVRQLFLHIGWHA